MKGHSFEVKIQFFLRQPGVVAPSKSLAGRRREQAGCAGLQSQRRWHFHRPGISLEHLLVQVLLQFYIQINLASKMTIPSTSFPSP